MRRSYIACAIALITVGQTSAQEPTIRPVPNDVLERYSSTWRYTQATARAWVNEQAASAKSSSIAPEQLQSYLHKAIQVRFGAQKPSPQSVELLVQLVFAQVAQDAEKDLRATLAEMKRQNEIKSKIRELSDSIRAAVARSKTTSATDRLTVDVLPRLTTISQLEANIGMEKPIAQRSVVTLSDVQALLTELESHFDSVNELSTQKALAIQNAMTRSQQLLQMLSSMLKASHSIATNIVQNLR